MKSRQPNLNAKHIAQTQLVLDRMKVTDASFWQLNAHHTIRLLHKYKARDFAQFMDVFDRDVEDQEGEALGVKKADDVFFERVVGLLPMFVKDMTNREVIRCFEVMVSRNIGS